LVYSPVIKYPSINFIVLITNISYHSQVKFKKIQIIIIWIFTFFSVKNGRFLFPQEEKPA